MNVALQWGGKVSPPVWPYVLPEVCSLPQYFIESNKAFETNPQDTENRVGRQPW